MSVAAVGTKYSCYAVTDSSTVGPESGVSPTTQLWVRGALRAPAAPTVSASARTEGQPLTVADALPTTGTGPYAWVWLASQNGGPFREASFLCLLPAGSGGPAGGAVSCSVANGTLASGNYTFELQVTDSASTPETVVSNASTAVTVATAPTPPTTTTATSSGFPTRDFDLLLGLVAVAIVLEALVLVVELTGRKGRGGGPGRSG